VPEVSVVVGHNRLPSLACASLILICLRMKLRSLAVTSNAGTGSVTPAAGVTGRVPSASPVRAAHRLPMSTRRPRDVVDDMRTELCMLKPL